MIFKETKGLMDEKVGGHFYLGSRGVVLSHTPLAVIVAEMSFYSKPATHRNQICRGASYTQVINE